MKIRWFGRTIQIINGRINFYNFKNEKNLIGTSFNIKEMKSIKSWKCLFYYLFFSYEKLNEMFISNQI